jgi:methylated-DNA-[protein]-cysteine S-methyltransferase
MKSFNERCYELLKTVPKGKVVTYKSLAQAMGTKAYRAVGRAMNKNPHAPIVPCHRVLASNGSLHGFAHGLKRKEEMLKEEGVVVENGKVNLDKFFHKF